ncbi:MAG: hypothetical protein JO110_06795 [Acetobacteraceae bacterium]|nr:hypothetical protein [Acetobacteraceae bacterium]
MVRPWPAGDSERANVWLAISVGLDPQLSKLNIFYRVESADEHLRIGRLLAAGTPPEGLAEHVFEIVGQLKHSAALIPEAEERDRVAELNLNLPARARPR